ncbi:MAG: VTT domain-containing protein [Gemmatimonadota bacterium]
MTDRRSIRIALLTVALAGCGAPASERATGGLAADVERSLTSGDATFDHSTWDSLLSGGTRDGYVDYAYMGSRASDLASYRAALASADLGSLAPRELEALLMNAYNALTVQSILDHPSAKSIRDIGGVWSERIWEVGGHSVTLDNVEHNLLRPFFRDPRIHFAVNCASRSCAPLPTWAFDGAQLEAQLEELTRAFLRDPANVRVDGSTLRVSPYFDWYGEDFVAAGWKPRAESIAEFIAVYATEEVQSAISADPGIDIEFNDYDWTLNMLTPPPPEGARAVRAPTGSLATFLAGFQTWVGGFGPMAPLVYGLGYIVFVILLVPGGALTLGAAFSFGFVKGGLIVFIAANIGAALAFVIGRYFLRSRVERWLSGKEKLSAIDRAVETQGWRVVALTRLSPVFPFNVQNYFYGLTGVSFGGYVLASLIGMVPGTVLYVYIGSAGAHVAQAAGGAASWGETALLIAGLAATFLAVGLVTRVAKRELDRATAEAAVVVS